MVAGRKRHQLFDDEHCRQQVQQRLCKRHAGHRAGVGLERIGPVVFERHASQRAIESFTPDAFQLAFLGGDVHGVDPLAFGAVEPSPASHIASRSGGLGQRGLEHARGRRDRRLVHERSVGWHGQVDLDLVGRRLEPHDDGVAHLQRLRPPPAAGQMALQFQHHHHPARIAPSPVVPRGRSGRKHGHDHAVAIRPFDHERTAGAQREQPAQAAGGRRLEAAFHRHRPFDPHRVEQRIPLAGEHRDDGVLLDDDVGRGSGPRGGIGQQVDRPRQWHREESLAAAIERAIDRLGLRAWTGEKHHAAAASDEGFERRDLRGVEPLHVEQPDAGERRQVERGEAPRRLDPRPQARGRTRARRKRRGHVEGITDAAAPRGVAVDQQHVDTVDHIDRHRPRIVGDHRIGPDPRLHQMRAGRGEPRVEPLRGHTAGWNFADPHARPAEGILAKLDGHVADRSIGVVANGDLEGHEHPRGGHATGHLQPFHRQIAWLPSISTFAGAVDEPHVAAGIRQLPQQRRRLVSILPVLEAEVADQPHHVGGPCAAVDQCRRGSQCGSGAGSGRRGSPARQFVPHLLHQPRRHGLKTDVKRRTVGLRSSLRAPLLLEPARVECRKASDRHLLLPRCGGQFGADSFHDKATAVEAVRVSDAAVRRQVAHRITVVEQHDVGRSRAAEHPAQRRLPPRLCQGQHDPQHGRHSQEQQQDLLEQHPRAVLPLARHQEFHRRPRHLAMPQQVDEVDDDRCRGDRQAPPEERQKIECRHGRLFLFDSSSRQPCWRGVREASRAPRRPVRRCE